MEIIKDIIRQVYPLLTICACVMFVIYVLFSANYNNGEGVFENIGNIYAPMFEDDELQKDGLNNIKEGTSCVLDIKYNSGAKQVGDCVVFKDLFFIRNEEEHALYLIDITRKGNSVLECLSTAEIEELEEIPAPFVYDKEQDLLYIHSSGTYLVQIKVYGKNGEVKRYEFNLPVEVS